MHLAYAPQIIVMRTTSIRMLTDEGSNILYDMMVDNKKDDYRAKIILLKADGYIVPEIRRATDHHDVNIRKWIHHHFNEKGEDGIISKIHKHKSIKIYNNIEKKNVEIVAKNPRTNYGGLPFSTWSLRTGSWIHYQGDKPS